MFYEVMDKVNAWALQQGFAKNINPAAIKLQYKKAKEELDELNLETQYMKHYGIDPESKASLIDALGDTIVSHFSLTVIVLKKLELHQFVEIIQNQWDDLEDEPFAPLELLTQYEKLYIDAARNLDSNRQGLHCPIKTKEHLETITTLLFIVTKLLGVDLSLKAMANTAYEEIKDRIYTDAFNKTTKGE